MPSRVWYLSPVPDPRPGRRWPGAGPRRGGRARPPRSRARCRWYRSGPGAGPLRRRPGRGAGGRRTAVRRGRPARRRSRRASSSDQTRSTSVRRWSTSPELSTTRSAPSRRVCRSGCDPIRAGGVLEGHAPVGDQPVQGQFGGRVHDHHGGQVQGLPVDGPEQRDVQHHDVVGAGKPVPTGDHLQADGRMGDGVEIGQGLGVAEDQGGHLGAVDPPLGVDDLGPEAVDERLIGRPVGGHHLAGDAIGVDQRGPVSDQEFGHRGLPRPDAAGEPDCQHDRDTTRSPMGGRWTPDRTRKGPSGAVGGEPRIEIDPRYPA